ncbi:MAG: alanine racemase [Gemmatimonadota bacterium]
MSRAWVEVDLDAVRANYETVRERVGEGVDLLPMVKADGYGLGAERVVRVLEPFEPYGYGVATAAEGAALRSYGVERPVLVFTPMSPGEMEAAARAGLTACISELGMLGRWGELASERRPLDFHVEIDTGMGRAGLDWRESGRWGEAIAARSGREVRWRGVFTHFQGAETGPREPTALQWERFREALERLPRPARTGEGDGGDGGRIVHAANSAAAMRWPEYAEGMVRPGLFLYGGHPAPHARDEMPAPRPVVSVRARIGLIKEVPPGHTVGYGATYAAERRERWGTLSIGYGDGLPLGLGNRGSALVRGRRVPIIGQVSMDMTVVDLTSVPGAEVGDAATLIGRDGDEEIPVEQVAVEGNTIVYEVLTGLTARLPRIERGAVDRDGTDDG